MLWHRMPELKVTPPHATVFYQVFSVKSYHYARLRAGLVLLFLNLKRQILTNKSVLGLLYLLVTLHRYSLLYYSFGDYSSLRVLSPLFESK